MGTNSERRRSHADSERSKATEDKEAIKEMSVRDDSENFIIRVKAAVPCEDRTNQTDCEAANCYWYNNACHSSPEPPPEPDGKIISYIFPAQKPEGSAVHITVGVKNTGASVQTFKVLLSDAGGQVDTQMYYNIPAGGTVTRNLDGVMPAIDWLLQLTLSADGVTVETPKTFTILLGEDEPDDSSSAWVYIIAAGIAAYAALSG